MVVSPRLLVITRAKLGVGGATPGVPHTSEVPSFGHLPFGDATRAGERALKGALWGYIQLVLILSPCKSESLPASEI